MQKGNLKGRLNCIVPHFDPSRESFQAGSEWTRDGAKARRARDRGTLCNTTFSNHRREPILEPPHYDRSSFHRTPLNPWAPSLGSDLETCVRLEVASPREGTKLTCRPRSQEKETVRRLTVENVALREVRCASCRGPRDQTEPGGVACYSRRSLGGGRRRC